MKNIDIIITALLLWACTSLPGSHALAAEEIPQDFYGLMKLDEVPAEACNKLIDGGIGIYSTTMQKHRAIWAEWEEGVTGEERAKWWAKRESACRAAISEAVSLSAAHVRSEFANPHVFFTQEWPEPDRGKLRGALNTLINFYSAIDEARETLIAAFQHWRPLSSLYYMEGGGCRYLPEIKRIMAEDLAKFLAGPRIRAEEAEQKYFMSGIRDDLRTEVAFYAAQLEVPDLDAQIYALAMEHKKEMLDATQPLFMRYRAYSIYDKLLGAIAGTRLEPSKTFDPQEFFRAAGYSMFFQLFQGISGSLMDPKEKNLAKRATLELPLPDPDVAIQLYLKGPWYSSNLGRVIASYPDTAVIRQFAAGDAVSGNFIDGAPIIIFSSWGYNTWGFKPSTNFEKIGPENWHKAEFVHDVDPSLIAGIQNNILTQESERQISWYIRVYAYEYCNLPETHPWLAETYFAWKKAGIHQRGRAEILAVLNHTAAIPVSEYLAVAGDAKADKLLRYAAAGALTTLPDAPEAAALFALYADSNSADNDFFLANVVLAMRRLPDSPERQKIFDAIMQNPDMPITRQQVRMIQSGTDYETLLLPTGSMEIPELKQLFFDISSAYAMDLYNNALRTKNELDMAGALRNIFRTLFFAFLKDMDKTATEALLAILLQEADSENALISFGAKTMLEDLSGHYKKFPVLKDYADWDWKKYLDASRPKSEPFDGVDQNIWTSGMRRII